MPRSLPFPEYLSELAAIGADSTGGITRTAFRAEDVAARRLVASWMAEAGVTVTLDAAANLIGYRAGRADQATAKTRRLAIGSAPLRPRHLGRLGAAPDPRRQVGAGRVT